MEATKVGGNEVQRQGRLEARRSEATKVGGKKRLKAAKSSTHIASKHAPPQKQQQRDSWCSGASICSDIADGMQQYYSTVVKQM